MIAIEIMELAGEAYDGEHVARFYVPRVDAPYDPNGAYLDGGDLRVRYSVGFRVYFKPFQ